MRPVTRRLWICVWNGFTAGLPLYVLLQMVPAWLRDQKIDLKTIGLISLVMLPYTFKFLWAPLVDWWVPPFLGRRRGWMLITQVGCLACIALLAVTDPHQSLSNITGLLFLLAVFSATQDVVLDAYRRELLPDNELGIGSTFYQNAYRVAGFIPGGLALILAGTGDWGLGWSWPTVQVVISLFMFAGILHTFLILETDVTPKLPKNIAEAYIDPFVEFFKRGGTKNAVLILAFMFLYKLGDSMATALATPFYIDMGFSLDQIGVLIKNTNFWSMLVGSFIGGAAIYRYGINRCLWVFGFLQWITIYGFAWLSMVGNSVPVLIFVLVMEYLAAGLGTSAFLAYIARVSSKNFSGTQLAMFSALFALARTLASSLTGFLIEGVKPADGAYFELFGEWAGLGWTHFFFVCGAVAIPGVVLMYWVAPWNEGQKVANA
jgi:MFS transporter, PAT family, beta-lactamase induction signal transducer AmpG